MLAHVRNPYRAARIGVGLFILLAVIALPDYARAAPTVSFGIAVSDPDYPIPICGGVSGTEFDTSIWVDDSGDSLGCFHLLMTYDRDQITLIDVGEGDLFAFSGVPTLPIWEYQDYDTTAFTNCLLGQRTYVLGPGELVKLRFRVRDDFVCPSDTLPPYVTNELELVTYREAPPPPDSAFFADIDRERIHGVTYLNALAWLCGACASSVSEAVDLPVGSLETSPNPVADRLQLRWTLPDQIETARVELFSASGRRVFAREVRGYEGSIIWDLQDPSGESVAAGTYFARLRCGDQTISRKFVKIN